jgi:signal transduction histidine kinase
MGIRRYIPSENKTYSWESEGAGRIESFLADKGTRLLLLTVALATASLVFVYPFVDTISLESAGDLNPAIRFVSQSLIIFVSFGVFFILWLPPRHLKTGQDIFIGAAFLSTGLLTFAHLITCSALLGLFVVAGSELGSYFHMMASVTMAAGLFIAAFVPAERSAPRSAARLILSALLVYTAVVVALAAAFAPSFPSLCPHGAEPAPVRYFVEIGMVLILSVAAVRFYQLGRKTNVMTFHYLACAVTIGAYGHLAFSLHEDFYDLFSMLSIALSIGSAAVVFVALFITSVIKPYDRVLKAQEQATRQRREAEVATVKAQTYLDFLGHDIANMISPIMTRAEMILHSPESTDNQKEEARKIVEQTQKISSLIGNVRRLSSAERIEAEELGSIDLRVLISELGTSRMESHPEKRLALTVRLPVEGDVRVLGGRVAEEIVTEVFDNAIKHSGTELVELEVNVTPTGSVPTGSYWAIEIIDHGQGIPDHTKMALDLSSRDPMKRWIRGVASGLSVMALVAERLGGRITVEDRVPGDYTKGTKVTVTLPRAT